MASLLDIGKNLKNRTNPIVKAMQANAPATRATLRAMGSNVQAGYNQWKQKPSNTFFRNPQQGIQNIRQAAGNILGGYQAQIGRQAMPLVNNRYARSAIESSTRIPGQIVNSLSYGVVNPQMQPAQSNLAKGTDFLSSIAGFSNSPITKGILRTTNPIAQKAVSRIAPGLAPIAGRFAPKIGGAVANIGQGFAFDAAKGQKPTITSVGIDAVTGLLGGSNQFSSRGMAKGMDQGRTTQSKWARDEVDMLDRARDLLLNKKMTKQDMLSAQENIKYLLKSHIPDEKIGKIILDYGGNEKGKLKAFVKELEKSAKRLNAYADDEPFSIPNLFGGNVQMGLMGGQQATGYKDATKFSSLLDKKPRFEIDDSGAKIIQATAKRLNQGGSAKLSEVLDHPGFFKNYPQLKDMKISSRHSLGSRGQYLPGEGIIIDSSAFNPSKTDKSTLLHEIQHAIQEIEGFARGGNVPESIDPKILFARRKDAVDIRTRLSQLNDLYGTPEFNNLPQSERARIGKEIVSLEDQLNKIMKEEKFGQYQRLSGELEARAVQRRMDMPANQRGRIDPYAAEAMATTGTMKPGDYITRFDGGNVQMGIKGEPITSVNPTGGVLVDYTPKARMAAPLGKNMRTLAETMKKSPEDTVTIYRGVSKPGRSISPGDFVTTDINSARSYGSKILTKKVKLGDIIDDVEQPLGGDYLYRPGASRELKNTTYDYKDSDWYKNYSDFLGNNRNKFPTLQSWIGGMRASGKSKSQLTEIWNNVSAPQSTGAMAALQDSGLGMGFTGSYRPKPQSTVGVSPSTPKIPPSLSGTAKQRIDNLINYPTRLKQIGYTDDQIKKISAPEAQKIIDNSIPPFSHPTFTGKVQQTGNQPALRSLPKNSYQAQTKALSGLSSQPQTGVVQKTTPKIQLPPEKEALVGFRSAPRHEYTTPNGKVNALDYLRTPDRVLSKLGLGKEAELLRKKELDYKQDLPKELDTVNKWWNEIGQNEQSSTNIFKYLDGQKQVQLNPTELKVAKEMRTYLSNWADKLQLPEDKRITHYITHIFEKDLLNKDFDPELAKLIRDRVPGSVYDPFLEQRLGKKGYVEDAFRAVDAYVKRATRKYHMDQALGELQNKAGRTLEESPLDAKSWEYVKEYVDRVNLRPTKIDELFDQLVKDSPIGYKLGDRPMAEVSRKMRRMVYRGTLGLNPRTALKNLTQGVNTYAELGEKYTTIGYAKTMRSLFGGDDELKRVGVLDNAMVQDRNLSAKKRVIERFDNGLFALFNLAEKVNRGAAYYGAKQRALSQGKPLNQAIQEGIDIARKTQFTFGQVDTPVALQSDVAKTLLQFQSFSLKQGEYLGEKLKNKEFAGLIRWAGANVLIITAFGELLGMDIKDLIPSVKVGGSPIFGLGGAVKDAAMDNPDQYNNERDAFDHVKNIGSKLVPFVPGGVAIKRAFEGVGAVNQGESKTKGGKTRFEIKQTPSNYVKAAALGQYSLPGAKEYFNKDKSKDEDVSLMDRIGEMVKPGSKASAEGGKITIPRDPEEAKIFYKQALQEINNAKGNRIKYTYDSSLTEDERKKKLDGDMEKNIRAVNTINQMRKQNPDLVFEVEAKTHSSSGGRTVDARASWVNDQLSKPKTKSEKESLINKLYEANVLTKSVVQELNKKFNLNINEYVSNGQIKSLGGKGKKIAIKKVTTTPFKLKSTKKISFRNKIPKAKITKTKGYRVLTYVDNTPTVKVSKPVVRWS